MSSFIELKQLVSAFIGAALALVGQWLIRKAAKAWTAKRLSLAFWEELSAVSFYGPPQYAPNFGGFSSQTFDTLFRELAESLPETLARDVMRYHWRMKFLEETKVAGGTPNLPFWNEAKELHEGSTPAGPRSPGCEAPAQSQLVDHRLASSCDLSWRRTSRRNNDVDYATADLSSRFNAFFTPLSVIC